MLASLFEEQRVPPDRRRLEFTAYIDTSALARLRDCKAELEGEIVGFTQQASRAQDAARSLLSCGYSSLCYPAASSTRFSHYLGRDVTYPVLALADGCPEADRYPAPPPGGGDDQSQYLIHVGAYCHGEFNRPSFIRPQGPGVSGNGSSPFCGWSGGLVEQCSPVGCLLVVSEWCLVCGSVQSCENFAPYSAFVLSVPLVLLTQIHLLEAIARCRGLLRLVVAAVAVLLSRLRSPAIRNEIAIRQRSFFTHHGAHPPRLRPLRASGLLSGRVFQLQFAF
jgi:hypothetical protein